MGVVTLDWVIKDINNPWKTIWKRLRKLILVRERSSVTFTGKPRLKKSVVRTATVVGFNQGLTLMKTVSRFTGVYPRGGGQKDFQPQGRLPNRFHPEVQQMEGAARPIIRKTFLKYITLKSLQEVETSLGYSDHHKRGATMAGDPQVKYFQSTYYGNPCLFLSHPRGIFLWKK